MYDFCLTIPYAAVLALGGLAGFLSKGSTASLAGGVGSAAVLAACAAISLQQYHKGRLCRPATLVSLLISAALTAMMWQRYVHTHKLMPAGIVAGTSAAMSAFYLWNLTLFAPAGLAAKQH